MEDALGGQGHFTAGLAQDLEPLALQVQDDGAENALFFEEFDNIAGFHVAQT